MEDLNKLRTFVHVAAEKSFTGAARKLNLTPSAVSKQVAELESQLGLALLTRSTRGVTLTEVGQSLYSRCTGILDSLDQAMASARGLQTMPQGTLRLHVITGFAQWVLAPLLPKFMSAYPDLEVDVTTSTPAMSLVRTGADVVVSGKTLPDPGLDYRDLGPTPYAVCASPAYFAEHGKPARPHDLARHNCLVHTIFAGRSWPFTTPRGHTSVRVGGNFTSNNSEVLRQVALEGLGIARLPVYTVGGDIAAKRLVPIFEGEVRTIQHMRVYFAPGRDLPAKARAFIDFLEQETGNRSTAPRKTASKSRRKPRTPA